VCWGTIVIVLIFLKMMRWAESTKTKQKPVRSSSLAGYLWKMKRKHQLHLPQWDKRWFSIEGKSLKWYAKEDSTEASGQISLLVNILIF
jgi:hypothetical protein